MHVSPCIVSDPSSHQVEKTRDEAEQNPFYETFNQDCIKDKSELLPHPDGLGREWDGWVFWV